MNRKGRILESLERFKYLRRWHIELLHYKGKKTGQRMCQDALKKLLEQKFVKRFRLGPREQYIYHIGNRGHKWQHTLYMNEFHFSILKDLHSWQKILYWNHEYKYPFGVADGLYVIKTTLEGGIKFFVEMDDGGNEFLKVGQYLSYAMNSDWKKEPWADPLGKGIITFPRVVIMTPRPGEIEPLITETGRVKFTLLSREFDNILKRIGP